MAERIADRLHAARARGFIGREREVADFVALLEAPALPLSVVFLFGPGGVGKSTLLRRFGDLSRAAGVPVHEVDARDLAPTAEAVRERVLPDTTAAGRKVLLLDTYELLGHLDEWFRRELLPQLPADTLVVLAGRDAPTPGWRTDPGWRSLVRAMPLDNFSPDQSRALLRLFGVPETEHPAVVEFTHGHPLALAVLADHLALTGGPFDALRAPQAVETLLDNLLQDLPDDEHRGAVAACAEVRVTTEPLLAELLEVPDAHEAFQWLRGLSFVQSGRSGIFPHDVARGVLAADLRWRDPDGRARLHERARRYYLRRLEGADDATQQLVLLDLLFLHRESPVIGPYLRPMSGLAAGEGLRVDRLRPADLPALLAMVDHHEGGESAALAERWLTRRPQGVRVVRAERDGDGPPTGFLAVLTLTDMDPSEATGDPGVAAAWRHLRSGSPLRPGEQATLARFWMAETTYQDASPVQSLLAVELTRHYLTTPGLAVTVLPFADPQQWAPFCAYAGQVRAPEADFTVGGRRYEAYAHDWRQVPPAAWVALLGERETALAPLAVAAPAGRDPLLVLSETEFAGALRAALRDLTRRDRLAGSPLLRSRLVGSRVDPGAGTEQRVAALQAAVREAADVLKASPRDARAHRALHRAYLSPAPSLERAAESLGLPSSTFRRHLAEGVARLNELLWQQELSA